MNQETNITYDEIDRLDELLSELESPVLRLGRGIEISSSDDGHSFTNNETQFAEIAINQAGTNISTAYFKKAPTAPQLHILARIERILVTEIQIIVL